MNNPAPEDRVPLVKRAVRSVGRPALFVLGCVFLAVGVAGLVLPLLPGTLFFILSAACFTRSSPRFEAWLLAHPTLGPPIRQWRETGAIPRGAKWFASISLLASWIIVARSEAPGAAKALTLVLFCGVVVYIVTRPEA
jgi:uncharacterized membrane protein YbaN (DUF454 family)